MLITSNDLLALSVFGNSFEYNLLYHLHKDGDETDWHVAPWILLHVLLEGRSDISFHLGLRNLPPSPCPFYNEVS